MHKKIIKDLLNRGEIRGKDRQELGLSYKVYYFLQNII